MRPQTEPGREGAARPPDRHTASRPSRVPASGPSALRTDEIPDTGAPEEQENRMNDIKGAPASGPRLIERDGEWEFATTDADLEANVALDAAIEDHESGRADASATLLHMATIASRWPYVIEARRSYGVALETAGFQSKAEVEYDTAFELGVQAIAGHKVQLGWYTHPNRPFLRSAAAKVWAYQRHKRGDKAAALMRKILRWCPNDGLGLRYQLGSQLLRNGDTKGAIRALKPYVKEEDPGLLYDLTLARFLEKNYARALTTARLALVRNPYIAEMLVHATRKVMSMPLSAVSNLRQQDGAAWYVEAMADLWENTGDALVFLRWAQTEPSLVAERAMVHATDGALLWESDTAERRRLIEKQSELKREMDHERSEELVQPRLWNRSGKRIAPWTVLHERNGYGEGQLRTVTSIEI